MPAKQEQQRAWLHSLIDAAVDSRGEWSHARGIDVIGEKDGWAIRRLNDMNTLTVVWKESARAS